MHIHRDTKPVMAAGQVNTRVSRLAVQQDLEMLRAWANRNRMKFDKNKYQVPQLGRKSPVQQPRLGLPAWGADLLKKKTLGALVSHDPGSRDGHQPPGLYQEQHSQQGPGKGLSHPTQHS